MVPRAQLERKLVAAVVVWGALAAGGLFAITAHGAAAGEGAAAPVSLVSALRTSGRATIVVAAHPSCPCTRATLHELDKLARGANGAADIVILFAGKPGEDHVSDELRRSAVAIPGARIVLDPKREVANSLGARTSGTVLFYDTLGVLRFSGGITPSRGHEGDSAGADAIRSLIRATPAASSTETPVYGCPLAATKP